MSPSPMQVLRDGKPRGAADIARSCGLSIESVYEVLVRAEARGLARVVIKSYPSCCRRRDWQGVNL